MYDSIPAFSTEGCLELVKKSLNFYEEYHKPKDTASDGEKRSYEYITTDLKEMVEYLEKYEEPDWYENKKLTDKERELKIFEYDRHRIKVVEAAISALRWNMSIVEDKERYVCFDVGGPICYNDWHDVRIRKEFLELIAFFNFYNYDIRTRTVHHQGSF